MAFLKPIEKSFNLDDGRTISVQTGKLARQADGSVLVRMGKAALLCTVVSSTKKREGANFFPLSVDYQEKFAGAGRIPGGFLKREGRASNEEILICRLVDRVLRPLFPDQYYYDTQVIIHLVSSDPEVQSDSLAAFAASAALMVSDIPFQGPISEVRVGRINGEFIINPSTTQMAELDLDLVVGATMDNIMMVEGEMKEVSEDDMIAALKVGHDAVKVQCQLQLDLAEAVYNGERPIREIEEIYENEELLAKITELTTDKLHAAASTPSDKDQRKANYKAVEEYMQEKLDELYPEMEEADAALVGKYFHKVQKHVIREMVMNTRKRLDGRELDEVRPLEMEVDWLPSPHGVSLFTRGETQALCTVTLGNKMDEKMVDSASGLTFRKFMLHYNFPPFSTGEARPLRGVGRREIGHGTLARRSIAQILPDAEDNPYTIRIVSDILESNGSSSMATVCGGSLALMDAGVKIKSNVSGIAMGMISDPNDPTRYAILSDILGDEDHLGDMDFKVTGTAKGICACQMDIKVDGLSYEILAEALTQAKKGRLHILSAMDECMSSPRAELKDHAPRIVKIFIKPEFIGQIIGPGGKYIQELQKETETTITIEEKGDKAEVAISGSNKEGIDAAIARVKAVAAEPEIGDEFEAIVKSIMPYGAFVEFLPSKQGLLHISEISWSRLESMDGVFEEGQKVKVKLVGIDPKSGKFKLSRKVLMPRPERKS